MFGVDVGTLVTIAVALAAAGAITGVLAGLFGIGGGAITVPILYEVFILLDVPPAVAMPLAVGTSLAIIIPTSLQSARGHYAKGAVDMGIVRAWALPVLVGVTGGAVIARHAPPQVFQAVFVVVATINATKLFFGKESWRIAPDMPGGVMLRVYGLVTGLASALMGIGGGAIANLILTLHGRHIRQAVATSAAVGVIVSIPGAIGYVWAGWGQSDLPPLSFGFVSVLAFILIVPTTLLTTPIGVRLAHTMPKRRLEILFGCFLTLVSLRFIAALTGVV
jgi:uncharacterized membrane protein YfcA